MILLKYQPQPLFDFESDPEPVPKKPAATKEVKTSKIPTDIFLRQLYSESGLGEGALYKQQLLSRSANSPLAVGPAQIQKVALDEYNKKYNKKYNLEDRLKPEVAAEIQSGYMKDLYNKDFINKPNQLEKVRIAKTLLAYNRGPGAAKTILTDLKNKGYDIYNSLDWVDKIPNAEGKKYVTNIIKGFSPEDETKYQKLIKNTTFKYD